MTLEAPVAAEPRRPEKLDRLMQGVIPYLALRGRAGEAADFYARAFAAEDLGRMPDPERSDRYMHLQIAINGGVLMMTDHMGDAGEDMPILPSGHLQLVVADGHAWWDRAVAAGCTVVMPYARQFWGDDWGLLVDPFGIRWAVLEPGPGNGA